MATKYLPGSIVQLPCASRTAAGAESEHLCLGTAFCTAGTPSSSSQSASLPHSPFSPASLHRYRYHHCRQPRGHARKEGQRYGSATASPRFRAENSKGAHRLQMCLLHRRGIALSFPRTKCNSKEPHTTAAARLGSHWPNNNLSTAFSETSKPQLSSSG